MKNQKKLKTYKRNEEKIISFIGKIGHTAARFFGLELKANNNCISCGKCWENCPEANITKNKKGKPHFGFNCLMCMRCIYNCPEKAISPIFSKFLPLKKGYSFNNFKNGKT